MWRGEGEGRVCVNVQVCDMCAHKVLCSYMYMFCILAPRTSHAFTQIYFLRENHGNGPVGTNEAIFLCLLVLLLCSYNKVVHDTHVAFSQL